MAKMFPPLFPYGLARVSTQTKTLVDNDAIRQMLYLHSSGSFGDISPERRQENLVSIKLRDGTIESRFDLNGYLFCITTYLDYGRSNTGTNYVSFDSDEKEWLGSSFPVHNITTFIKLATLHQLVGQGVM